MSRGRTRSFRDSSGVASREWDPCSRPMLVGRSGARWLSCHYFGTLYLVMIFLCQHEIFDRGVAAASLQSSCRGIYDRGQVSGRSQAEHSPWAGGAPSPLRDDMGESTRVARRFPRTRHGKIRLFSLATRQLLRANRPGSADRARGLRGDPGRRPWVGLDKISDIALCSFSLSASVFQIIYLQTPTPGVSHENVSPLLTCTSIQVIRGKMWVGWAWGVWWSRKRGGGNIEEEDERRQAYHILGDKKTILSMKFLCTSTVPTLTRVQGVLNASTTYFVHGRTCTITSAPSYLP